LKGVSATAKPWASAASVSIPAKPPFSPPPGRRHPNSVPSTPAGRTSPSPRVNAT
jgi:hypothetical protein